MILFIIPIKPTVNEKVYELLHNTLESIFNIKGCVQVITVSNIPIQIFNETNIVVDTSYNNRPEFDRAYKVKMGYAYSKLLNPDYIMVFDYDDYISCNLLDYIGATKYGYYFESGYIYENKKELYLMPNNFYHYCGSALIVKPDYLPQLLKHNVYSHFQNHLLEPISEPLVVYNRCNGENFFATEPLNKNNLLICL
jgi:hypothetical protein